jgi:hypothetical protein
MYTEAKRQTLDNFCTGVFSPTVNVNGAADDISDAVTDALQDSMQDRLDGLRDLLELEAERSASV